MKNILLTVVCLSMACATFARPAAPRLPKFLHATYSVESLLTPEEVNNPSYDAFQFIYLMATPAWSKLDFDQPRDSLLAEADRFDYRTGGGKRPLVPRLIEQAHEQGARVLLCFGGQQEFRPFLERPERIANLADYMVRVVANNDYDGLDIDWEITLDKMLHAELMERLRSGLDALERSNGRRYFLTTALSIDHVYDRKLARRLSRTADWINVMSYDMCDGVWGSVPSHNTSMERLRSKLNNWKEFDRKKICLGLANYGFYYKGLVPGQKADGPLSKYGSYIPYRQFLPRLSQGWTEEYDPQAEVSYFFSPDRSEFVTIDNEASILRKIEWMTRGGFRGVFWWEFHHDYRQPNAAEPRGGHYLIDGVTEYLRKR